MAVFLKKKPSTSPPEGPSLEDLAETFMHSGAQLISKKIIKKPSLSNVPTAVYEDDSPFPIMPPEMEKLQASLGPLPSPSVYNAQYWALRLAMLEAHFVNTSDTAILEIAGQKWAMGYLKVALVPESHARRHWRRW